MSANVFRNVSEIMFACYASLRKGAKIKSNIFTTFTYYLTISFRCFDVRSLRTYGTVLSLYVLLVTCPSYQGMKWFLRAITKYYSLSVSFLDARSFLQPHFF